MDQKTPKPVKQTPRTKRIHEPAPEKTYRVKFTPAQKRVYFDIWAQYHDGTLKNPRDGSIVDKYIVAKGVAWAAVQGIKDESEPAATATATEEQADRPALS